MHGYSVDEVYFVLVEAIRISDGWLQGVRDGRAAGKATGY
jgi:hypothetical protein